jgi:aryl-alcohol dehydrogenase-like predicted oxidoreductase
MRALDARGGLGDVSGARSRRDAVAMSRTLGNSGIQVSDIGFGRWAIGGQFTLNCKADGWGDTDDRESVAAIRRGLELGITFRDTADVYGTGPSEDVLGRTLNGHRDQVVISTKVGYAFGAARLRGRLCGRDYGLAGTGPPAGELLHRLRRGAA